MVSVCLPSDALLQHLPSWVSLTLDVGYFLMAQLVKNPSAMQEILVQFLGWEDPLKKG